MIGAYPFNGQDEYCLTIDKSRIKRVLIIAPLFEEANRVRHLLVETMRELDQMGVDSFLPDLPSRNESLTAPASVDIASWQSALNACAAHLGGIGQIVSVRGGCLLDHVQGASAVWRLAPTKGAQILRAMVRTRIASEREDGNAVDSAGLMTAGMAGGISLAGNWLSASMVTQLAAAVPSASLPCREVKVGPSGDFAANTVYGSPLWLRAEPDHDPAMARAMATDIAQWVT